MRPIRSPKKRHRMPAKSTFRPGARKNIRPQYRIRQRGTYARRRNKSPRPLVLFFNDTMKLWHLGQTGGDEMKEAVAFHLTHPDRLRTLFSPIVPMVSRQRWREKPVPVPGCGPGFDIPWTQEEKDRLDEALKEAFPDSK